MPSLDDQALNSIAHRMLADYDAVAPGTVFSEGLRLEVADAWRVQDAVTALREARGERVVGYKIGCVSQGNQELMGLNHPAWGRLWEAEQHEDGAALRKADFANVAMEAEFAITLSGTLDPEKCSPGELLSVIEAVYPVIEIHNLVLRGEAPHGHELLANNAIHAGVVRGLPVTDLAGARETDLALIHDGVVVDSWDVLRWPDEILPAIGWLAEHQAEAGRRLEKGALILTGAFGPPIPLGEGTRVDVTSSAFGNVSARFT